MSSPTPVTDRLQRLAEHAPPRLGDPDQLWSRGRRRQRARWAGTAACLVLLAVLGGGAVPAFVDRTQDLVADTPQGALHLPDVVRQPGEWEPAFDGAPGPLVAAGVAARGGWWGSRPALWGVSATTGESRFLDLPEVAFRLVALSADGRRLAYWFTDEDIEALPGNREPGASIPPPTAGVAVVDLATGDIERWDLEAPHGLLDDGLAWAGDVLWWRAGPFEPAGEDGTRARVRNRTWDVRTDERRVLEKGTPGWDLAPNGVGLTPDGFLVNGGTILQVVRGERVARTMRLDTFISSQDGSVPALSPDGARLAAIPFSDPDVSDSKPPPLVVSGMDGRTSDFTQVGDVTSDAVFGWRSADEVVIQTYRGEDLDRVYGASVVDVDTAEVTPLVDFRGNVSSFAADAWSAEVIQAPDAPWAPDPRLLGLAVLIVGTFLVSLANSVRRRRGHP